MGTEKISVIVPVYNTSEYLSECVSSILGQTYRDIEVILVDDGSTDGSGVICDRFSQTDERVKVIHQSNGGLSTARNSGIEAAAGRFVSFVDSDDFVHPYFLEVLKYAVDFFNTPIAECEFQKVHGNVPFLPLASITAGLSNTEEVLLGVMRYKSHYPMAWNKLYKREFLDDLRFPAGKINEDEFFVNQWILRFPKIARVAEPLYFYRQRTDSIMALPITAKRLEVFEAVFARLEIIKKNFPKLERQGEEYLKSQYSLYSRQIKDEKLLSELDDLVKPHLIDQGDNPAVFESLEDVFRAVQAYRTGLSETAPDTAGITNREKPKSPLEIEKREYMLGYIKRHSNCTRNKPVEPFVSVCVPYYNDTLYFDAALNSLLSNNYPAFEVIVVDDGSDIPLKISDLKVLRKKNGGPASARNFAAKHASGEYLIFCDSDNIYERDMISKLVRGIEVSGADCLTSYCAAFSGNPYDPKNRLFTPLGGCAYTGVFENTFGDMNCIIRSKIFHEVGGLDENIRYEDWAFFAKLTLLGYDVDVLPEAVYRYRDKHDGVNTSFERLEGHRGILDIYRKYGGNLLGELFVKMMPSLYSEAVRRRNDFFADEYRKLERLILEEISKAHNDARDELRRAHEAAIDEVKRAHETAEHIKAVCAERKSTFFQSIKNILKKELL